MLATLSKFQLIVDEEKTEKIKNSETIELTIPKETATVKISQYDAKTNEVTVTDGDQMTIALIIVLIGQNIIL